MNRVVINSSILLADILPDETLHHHAKQILEQWQANSILLYAPVLFRYEVVAVIRKSVYQKRITSERGQYLLAYALHLPIEFDMDDVLLKRAYALAEMYQRPTAYDSQYLALAEKLQCEFWTADERMFNSVRTTLTWVNWLGNFMLQ